MAPSIAAEPALADTGEPGADAPRPLKILVVDDHALVREGLRQVLKGLAATTEVLDAATGGAAFELSSRHPDLDLVLLDYHLPDMDGMQALLRFRTDHPELPIVILSGSANPETMRRVLQRGAAGFVTKSSVSDELLRALRLVMDGEVYVPAEAALAGAVVLPSDQAATQPPLFTRRQEDVLRQLLDGRSNREIGTSLHLSEETVKSHVSAILRGFGVQTRLQAVLAAGRHGFRSRKPAGAG